MREYLGETVGHIYFSVEYFLPEASDKSCLFLSFIELDRYVVLHMYLGIYKSLDSLFTQTLQNPWYLHASASTVVSVRMEPACAQRSGWDLFVR